MDHRKEEELVVGGLVVEELVVEGLVVEALEVKGKASRHSTGKRSE